MYKIYLVGSVKIWREQFLPKYSKFFSGGTVLFEPGRMNIPSDHTRIAPSVAFIDSSEIRKADAVLVFMKEYKPDHNAGPAGTDSAWECGFAHGLCKPIIAIIEDEEQLHYFEQQWMLTFHVDVFVVFNKKLADTISKSRLKDISLIQCDAINDIETKIIKFLDSIV